jgi:hypothetical protein
VTRSRARRRRARDLVVALVGLAAWTSAALRAQPREVDVRTSLDRTAMWVADRVGYTITVTCGKGVDILADDLSKDKLRADGLEIVGSSSDRTTGPGDMTVYTFRYVLTTYRVDLSELKIAPIVVRYYVKRPGQRIGDAAPAGEVQVPAAVIAFRSALPDGQETYAIRDGRDARPRRLRYSSLAPIGAALILIAIVPAAVAASAVVRRARPREKPRSARQVKHDERASLDALRAIDVSTPAGRRDAYARMNALVRDHLHVALGVEAASLTPAEIDAAIAQRGARVPIELVAAVLAACDHARYGPPETLPSAEACQAAIAQAAQVVEPA